MRFKVEVSKPFHNYIAVNEPANILHAKTTWRTISSNSYSQQAVAKHIKMHERLCCRKLKTLSFYLNHFWSG